MVSIRFLIGDSCFFNILNIHPEKIYSEDGLGVNHQLLRQFGKSDDTKKIVEANGSTNFHVSAVYPDMVYQNVMYEEKHPTPYAIIKEDEFVDGSENSVQRNYGRPREALVKYHGDRKKVEEAMCSLIQELTGHEASEVHSLTQRHEEWYEDYERFLSC